MIATAYRNAIIAHRPLSWTDTLIVATTSALALITAAPGLYLVKSALGINLLPGPSPFHDIFYWMIV